MIYIELYRTPITREYRWRVKSSRNGKKMANGGEGYKNKADCISALCTVLGVHWDIGRSAFRRGDQIITMEDTTGAA